MKSLYERVRLQGTLWSSWNQIRSNGISSRSNDIQKEVRLYEGSIVTNLKRISTQLRGKKYQFQPATGVAQKRKGKSDRPIVISPVENRIVQRAILDVIQGTESLAHLYNHPNSYGGIRNKSVEAALTDVASFIKSGGQYYAATDIKKFFTKIDRQRVLDVCRNDFKDDEFYHLFESALKTELLNIDMLTSSGKADLFPIYDLGVAQGCCLSPLAGNILLRDFDEKMQSKDVRCFRYIDDFIIIGPDMKTVQVYFKRAVKMLTDLGLDCYLPGEPNTKYCEGEVKKIFNYLGCQLNHEVIRPSPASWNKLKNSIDELFSQSLISFSDIDKMVKTKTTFSETMYLVGHKLQGWGNQYSFCNDRRTLANYNREIQKKFEQYKDKFDQKSQALSLTDRSRAFGLFSLEHSKSSPIYKL